jgi:hypothetical protein
MMRYQVGDLFDIKKNDPVFDDLEIAIHKALSLSYENEESAFGVGEADEQANLVGIAHRDKWFQE